MAKQKNDQPQLPPEIADTPQEANQAISFINLKNVILREFKEAGMSSSMHGLPNILRAESYILKIIWIFILLGATAVCSYLIVLNVQDYLKYEVVTSVYGVSEVPVKFPTVTICNKSPYSSPIGTAFVKSVLEQDEQDLLQLSNTLGPEKAISLARYLVGSAVFVSNMTQSEKQALGMSFDDMLISCIFETKPCTSSQFSWSWNILYGNCYSFNSGVLADGTPTDDKMMSRPGWYDGLGLELYVGRQSDVYSLSSEAGVHIFVQNKTDFISIFEGYSASVGKLTRIGVKRDFHYDLPKPYSPCTSQEEINKSSSIIVQDILKTPYTYRFSDCEAMCINEYILSQCDCEDLTTITSIGDSFCLNSTQIACSIREYPNFFTDDRISSCSNECPIECERVEFELQFSMAEYPSYSYYKLLANVASVQSKFGLNASMITHEMLKETTLSLNINYEKLGYNCYDQDPMIDLIELISGLGGTLGLFVGMSFLSFFEVLDAVFGVVYFIAGVLINKSKKKSSKIFVKPKNINSK